MKHYPHLRRIKKIKSAIHKVHRFHVKRKRQFHDFFQSLRFKFQSLKLKSNNYSFNKSERKRKIVHVANKVQKFHLKHENTLFLLVSIGLAYFFLSSDSFSSLVSSLGKFGYISAFVLGFLFSFGFTTAPSAATLYILSKFINPFLMSFIAAIGAMISTYLIYSFVKYRLIDEVRYIFDNELRLEFSKFELAIAKKKLKSKYFKYIIPVFSGILTAMPIPTEMIVTILWNVDKIETRNVFLLSFIFSFIGILALALIQNF